MSNQSLCKQHVTPHSAIPNGFVQQKWTATVHTRPPSEFVFPLHQWKAIVKHDIVRYRIPGFQAKACWTWLMWTSIRGRIVQKRLFSQSKYPFYKAFPVRLVLRQRQLSKSPLSLYTDEGEKPNFDLFNNTEQVSGGKAQPAIGSEG